MKQPNIFLKSHFIPIGRKGERERRLDEINPLDIIIKVKKQRKGKKPAQKKKKTLSFFFFLFLFFFNFFTSSCTQSCEDRFGEEGDGGPQEQHPKVGQQSPLQYHHTHQLKLIRIFFFFFFFFFDGKRSW